MSSPPTQLHNIVALGEMSGVLAVAFPSFALDTAVLSTRSLHVAEAAKVAEEWPAALFHERVAFNWLFLNAGDLPAACRLIRWAQYIAPTLVYCHAPEGQADAAQLTALVDAEMVKDGYGIMLSCYTSANFHAPRILQAFLGEAPIEQHSPVRLAQEIRMQDPCYAPARELVLSNKAVSLSMVQRTLGIGYTHASRLIDAMVGDILVRVAVTGGLSLRQTCIGQV